MTISMAFTVRSFLLRLAVGTVTICFLASASPAGGPKYVAGTSYFNPIATGQTLVWPQGLVAYYTDQGDLSPILPNAAANTFVASAFSPWNSVTTAALTATRASSLAEDVNGTNVFLNADGTVSMPLDVQPGATSTPVGIVYDYDGSVTDALMGAGAGATSQCFSNAVFGGTDNFGTLAVFQHALIVINGQCALQPAQLNDVKYRLMRTIGSVLGLGWSQVNPNVLTGSPHPSSEDFAGFPVMHFTDPWNCVPITFCYPTPTELSMDDAAALSRLYPVTATNLSSFPGKQVFSTTTACLHGSVSFSDANGNPGQAMQGVNVVARWIDPTTGQPSRRYAASSVSGFLFTGNTGNPITGFDDATGDSYAEWGSNDQTLEGSYNLCGLKPPNNNSTQYQLSVESLNAQWSAGVGPYAPGPVAPYGWFSPIVVTVALGSDVRQDILLRGSAQPPPQVTTTWTKPASLSAGGDWVGTLTGYGAVEYVGLMARANRTLSVAVTALDESGNSTQVKTQPVIGMWAASDPPGTPPPAFTTSPFNQVTPGVTRLDAQVGASSAFLIGISDVRGDGRPDYRYHAHVLYADSVSPARIGANGGVVSVQGIGFSPGLTVTIGNRTASPLAVSSGQILIAAPPQGDGSQTISVSDPVSGASSIMTNALTFGAASSDNLDWVGIVLNSSTPVGTRATNPLVAQVVAADHVTLVRGATIGWSATNGVQLSACGGASSCSVISDENGMASTWLTPSLAGVSTITATLAPGTYTPAKSKSATLSATQLASDIGVFPSYASIAKGATLSIPLTARVMSGGVPQSGVNVNFTVVKGLGTLSPSSAPTDSAGYATVSFSALQIDGDAQVSACVGPGNAPCRPIRLISVALADQNLWPVTGSGQVSAGESFQPIVVRVTDSASPPNSVIGANVAFQTTVLRPGGNPPAGGTGETHVTNPAMLVILHISQNLATTDMNGLAALVPSPAGFSGPVEVDVRATAGANGSLDYPLELLPSVSPGPSSPSPTSSVQKLPVRLRRYLRIQGGKADRPDAVEPEWRSRNLRDPY